MHAYDLRFSLFFKKIALKAKNYLLFLQHLKQISIRESTVNAKRQWSDFS